MKKMVLIIPFVVIIVFGCAKTPIDRAKINVKQYIKTMLNEPEYYESVAWSSLDSAYYNDFGDTPRGIQLMDSCILAAPLPAKANESVISDSLKGKQTAITKLVWWYRYAWDKANAKEKYSLFDETSLGNYIASYKKEQRSYKSQKPLFRGYEIDHSFRIRGLKKQKILVKYTFYLDSALTVTGAEDQEIRAIDSSNKKGPLGLFPEER